MTAADALHQVLGALHPRRRASTGVAPAVPESVRRIVEALEDEIGGLDIYEIGAPAYCDDGEPVQGAWPVLPIVASSEQTAVPVG